MIKNGASKKKGGPLDGCLTIFIILLTLAYWQPVLLTAAVAGIVYGLYWLIKYHLNLYRKRKQAFLAWRLGKTVITSGKSLSGRLCRFRERYYLINGLNAASTGPEQAWIYVITRGFQEYAGHISTVKNVLQFKRPADQRSLRTSQRLIDFLSEGGLDLLDEISLEGKALRASLDCLEQAEWARSALKQLSTLETDIVSTLAKAHGNELLEPSIPQLQEALASFEGQRSKLNNHIETSANIAKKLFDYLAVPEGVRSIINFDLDTLIDISAFKDLEDSFNEVVTINDAFRELNRGRTL